MSVQQGNLRFICNLIYTIEWLYMNGVEVDLLGIVTVAMSRFPSFDRYWKGQEQRLMSMRRASRHLPHQRHWLACVKNKRGFKVTYTNQQEIPTKTQIKSCWYIFIYMEIAVIKHVMPYTCQFKKQWRIASNHIHQHTPIVVGDTHHYSS